MRFRGGRDANKMLMRKLAVNFFVKGKITTTKAKAKTLKSYLEKIVTKTKKKTQANQRFMYKNFGSHQIVKLLFEKIGPAVKEKTSGYFKISFLGPRLSDGSEMVKLDWVLPVVLDSNQKKPTLKTPKDKTS